MSDFVVKGYQAPEGVRYKEQVEEVQRLIGAKVDGTWGSESQRKWEAFQKREPSRMSGYMLAYSMALDTGEKRHRESVRQARARESLSAQEYNRRQNAQARTVAGYTKPKEYQLVSQVEAFQRAHGLKVDGVWGPASQAAYQKSKEQETAPARALKGYRIPTEYNTVAKLKAFQEKNGLKVDGIWGPQTDAEYKRLKAPKITNLVELKKQDAEAMQKLKAEQSTPARALRGYRVPAEYNTVFKLKVFQNKYGLKQDGVWGPDCEKAYQMEKQTARRTQEQRKREQEQERARQQEQERLAEIRRNGQTPQDLDPAIAGMRGYNQMNLPRGTQSRGNPPTTKAAAPQDNDPATQALRGPNRLKTTKSKTDTKTTGGGPKTPQDVNTDAMRGFHNPDYAEQDENWVRTLPETSVDKEDVVGSLVTEDELNRHMKRRAMADAFGYWGLPFSDATAGEFETTRNELAGRIPEGLGFSVADIHHMNQGVILDDKQLVAHGGGTEQQRQKVCELNFTKQLLSILFEKVPLPKLNITQRLLSTDAEMSRFLDQFMKYKSRAEDYLNVLSTKSGIDLNNKVYVEKLNRLREKAKRTEKALASLRKGDIYYRVFLKNLPNAQKNNTLQIPDGYSQAPIQAPAGTTTTQRELILYFRKEGGREKLMFIMRTDTMEVVWP